MTFFSFDDHSIPWKHNLKLTLKEAKKYPANPVLKRGMAGSPDQGHAILYGSVIKVGDKFRMWYLGMHETHIKDGQAPGNWRPMCYAESSDGINWVKPELGLVDFNGNKNNNICLIEGEPLSLTRVNDFLSVLYEPDDPDTTRRYKALFIAHVPYNEIAGGLSQVGHTEATPCVTIGATSSDGLNWRVIGDRPLNAGGERFEVSGLYKFGKFYYATGQLLSPWSWLADGTEAGRIVQVYRSADFENWSLAKADAFMRVGQLTKPPMAGQQNHMGFGLWNRNNVMVGLYGIWQDGPKMKPDGFGHLWGTSVDLGLVISNDGIHYREPVTDFKIISRGNSEEWDGTALLQGHAFVNEGDSTMIWYSHWDTGGKLKNMDIGLAMLRRDGFGFLSSNFKSNNAHFISSPIEWKENSKLYLNIDSVTAEYPMLVELLDGETGAPIPGFSGEHAAKLTSGGVRKEVTWESTDFASVSLKQPVEVKLTFPPGSRANFYALYIEN